MVVVDSQVLTARPATTDPALPMVPLEKCVVLVDADSVRRLEVPVTLTAIGGSLPETGFAGPLWCGVEKVESLFPVAFAAPPLVCH